MVNIMGAYAVPTNLSIITNKDISVKKKLSPEAVAIRNFCRTHKVEVTVNDDGTRNVKVMNIEDDNKISFR